MGGVEALIFFTTLSHSTGLVADARVAIDLGANPERWLKQHTQEGIFYASTESIFGTLSKTLIIEPTEWQQTGTLLRCFTYQDVHLYVRSEFHLAQMLNTAISTVTGVPTMCLDDAMVAAREHNEELYQWALNQYQLGCSISAAQIMDTWFVLIGRSYCQALAGMELTPVVGRRSAEIASSILCDLCEAQITESGALSEHCIIEVLSLKETMNVPDIAEQLGNLLSRVAERLMLPPDYNLDQIIDAIRVQDAETGAWAESVRAMAV